MQIVKHIEINRIPGRHLAFPCLRRAADGRILITYREAAAHCDPEGRIMLQASADEGETWDAPRCVIDPEGDARDGCFEALADGRIMMAAFVTRMVRPYTDEEARRWQGNSHPAIAAKMWKQSGGRQYVLWSDDCGETWTDALLADDRGACTRDGPRQLRDGRIVMPAWCFCEGLGKADRPTVYTELLVSSDRGESWSTHCVAGRLPDRGLGEPCFCETASGRWVVQMRTTGWPENAGVIVQAESEDQGETWSEPQQLDAWGFPQTLLQHSNGALYSFFGHRRPPIGVRGMRSDDGGRTWQTRDEFAVAEGAVHKDQGYPNTVELSDGNVLVVYYYCDERDPFPYVRGTILTP